MKKRRLAIVAFLICATLIAGIGYAGTTETLTINGTASTTATDINVRFSSATLTTQASGGGATAGQAGGKSLSLTANGLKTAGEFIVATYVIQNDSAYPVTLGVPTISENDTTNFDVTTSFEEAVELGAKGAEDSTYEFTVTVKLLTTPNTVAGLSTSFTITIGANGK